MNMSENFIKKRLKTVFFLCIISGTAEAGVPCFCACGVSEDFMPGIVLRRGA